MCVLDSHSRTLSDSHSLSVCVAERARALGCLGFAVRGVCVCVGLPSSVHHHTAVYVQRRDAECVCVCVCCAHTGGERERELCVCVYVWLRARAHIYISSLSACVCAMISCSERVYATSVSWSHCKFDCACVVGGCYARARASACSSKRETLMTWMP